MLLPIFSPSIKLHWISSLLFYERNFTFTGGCNIHDSKLGANYKHLVVSIHSRSFFPIPNSKFQSIFTLLFLKSLLFGVANLATNCEITLNWNSFPSCCFNTALISPLLYSDMQRFTKEQSYFDSFNLSCAIKDK